MHTNELSLLRRICDATHRLSVHDLTPEERGMLSTLRRDGLITQNLDGFLLPRDTAFPALKDAEQRLSLDEAFRAQEESFRQQLIQVQQQSADALERMRKDFAEYQREHNRQNQQNSLDHAKMEKKNRRSTWLQIIFTAVFSPLAALCVEHFQDIVIFFQSLLHE